MPSANPSGPAVPPPPAGPDGTPTRQVATAFAELSPAEATACVLTAAGQPQDAIAALLEVTRSSVSRMLGRDRCRRALAVLQAEQAGRQRDRLAALFSDSLGVVHQAVLGGDLPTALAIVRAGLSAKVAELAAMPPAIEARVVESGPQSLADLFDEPVDDATLLDFAEHLSDRAKRQEVVDPAAAAEGGSLADLLAPEYEPVTVEPVGIDWGTAPAKPKLTVVEQPEGDGRKRLGKKRLS